MIDDLSNKYRKKNPFTVPEGYFDTLEDQIINRIEKEKKPKKINFVRMLKPYIGLAGIFVFALVVVNWILPHFIDNSKMLLKKEEETVVNSANEKEYEIELDADFNPAREEIIEYLAQKGDITDFFLMEEDYNN